MTTIRPRITASFDPSLHAEVDDLMPLAYSEPPPPRHDLPTHVRSASAVRRLEQHLVIVQDDVNALAVYDPAHGDVLPILLPRGPGERRTFDDVIGNKHDKMDLEALASLPDERLVAFGSGASAAREGLVVVSKREPPVLRDGTALYRSLRGQPAFAGSELNIEGAIAADERLLLFQRGNGAARDGLGPTNAIGTIDLAAFVRWLDDEGPLPPLLDVTPFDLGNLVGLPLGFTDAAVTPDGRIAIIACAEDSPDALTDGPVLGCRFGWLEADGTLRMTDVLECGRRAPLKLEGIESRPGGKNEFDVVADVDSPHQPALLGRLRIRE